MHAEWHDNAIALIGNTPMVRTQHLDVGVCELYLKLECNNPTGSIKRTRSRTVSAFP